MIQIRKILQCVDNGWSIRKVNRETGISRNTIRGYLHRAKEQDVGIQDLLKLDDSELNRLILQPITEEGLRYKALSEQLPHIKKEMRKLGVTRKRLWAEYREQHIDGYGYSQFCDYLQQWLKAGQIVMHHHHSPGELMEVDYAGKKLSYIDKDTGEVIDGESLITVLPYSNMIYLEVLPNQKQEHLAVGLVHALEYYEGVTEAIKLDNMRSAVTKSDRYEPTFTDLMDEFAGHYGTTAITARVGKPRDKASVEASVRIVYQEIYAELRDQVVFSIDQLNAAIRPLLDQLNDKQMQGRDYSRRSRFNSEEKPLLRSLPTSRFIVRKTAQYKVQKNYHILLGEDRHYYSVPFRLVGKTLTVRYSFKVIEIYHDMLRVATHERIRTKNEWTTVPEHMPPNHQHVREVKGWTAQDVEAKACQIGEYTLQATKQILSRKIFVEQAFNSCLGIQKLGRKYGNDRLELACKRALSHGATPTYKMIRNILELRLDQAEIQNKIDFNTPDHNNIRGAQSYQWQ